MRSAPPTSTSETLAAAAARFEAARRIEGSAPGHRLRGLHGHGFVATLHAALPPAWAGWPGGEVPALQQRLAQCTQRLDYGLLNEHLADPDDANLARWLASQVNVPGLRRVGVQSTPGHGAELDAQGRVQLWRRWRFQAAHRLPNVPAGHQCGRMHGHGFGVVVHAGADDGLTHEALDRAWDDVAPLLDYRCLNDIGGLENPTSEVLAGWLWQRLQPALPTLASVAVQETGSSGAAHDGQRWRIWKDCTLDSAVRLALAPEGDARRRLHGHTFRLRLQLAGELDAVLGWVQDFGDVKAVFDPVFRALDHHPLHEQPGLEDGDTTSIARWIHERARQDLPQLVRVDLIEAEGCGAIVGSDLAGPLLPA